MAGRKRRIVVEPAVEMRVDRMQFWAGNPRWLPEEGEAGLTRSMLESPQMLWAKPLLVTPSGTVLWGNQRLRVARKLGLTTLPTSIVSGLTEPEEKTWALADNNTYGLWDARALGQLLAELAGEGVDVVLTGFASADLDRYLAPFVSLLDPDAAPELPVGEPESRPGESYELTVETLWLGRLYVLFFIELGSRRVHLAGCSANPDGRWTAQQARQLAWSLPDRARPIRFLIRDRDSKFSRAFDDVFTSEGIEIIRTPFRAPNANAFAERWVGTVRRECLDWLLIASRRQLERVLRVYVDHYNTHRPHRALGLRPPAPAPRLHLASARSPGQIQRRERLGGLINEYARAA